jgi:hypothetical protein
MPVLWVVELAAISEELIFYSEVAIYSERTIKTLLPDI